MSMSSWPRPSPPAKPSSPSTTCSSAWGLATIVIATSTLAAACAGVAATAAPRSASGLVLSAVRFQTVRSWPVSSSRVAIGVPISPSTRNASFAICVAPFSHAFGVQAPHRHRIPEDRVDALQIGGDQSPPMPRSQNAITETFDIGPSPVEPAARSLPPTRCQAVTCRSGQDSGADAPPDVPRRSGRPGRCRAALPDDGVVEHDDQLSSAGPPVRLPWTRRRRCGLGALHEQCLYRYGAAPQVRCRRGQRASWLPVPGIQRYLPPGWT
jgi:hypothetical protein